MAQCELLCRRLKLWSKLYAALAGKPAHYFGVSDFVGPEKPNRKPEPVGQRGFLLNRFCAVYVVTLTLGESLAHNPPAVARRAEDNIVRPHASRAFKRGFERPETRIVAFKRKVVYINYKLQRVFGEGLNQIVKIAERVLPQLDEP